MDEHSNALIGMKIEKTIENLKKNNMDAYYVGKCEEIIELVKEICPEGLTVSCGGSMTLNETGVMELLRSGRYKFLDREAQGADATAVMREALTCDTYFMSSNAVTEAGELYNVDGNGNRLAALMFGPKNVIVVVGYNKLVRDANAAAKRVCELAAPANCHRLNRDTPCQKVGSCCDCHVSDRICCHYLLSKFQRVQGRIKVILVGEPLGY